MNKQCEVKNGAARILRIIGLVVAGILIIPIVTLLVARGVNDIRFRLPDGVREKIYVQLGGVEQFINIRGSDIDNPVVVWLHGGPGGTDTFMTTTFQQELESDYTFIRWDQRGCGRTYYKSKDAPLSWDLMLADLNDLVDYAAERFRQPIIIVGHSWGSALGSTYAEAHAEKIVGYVGIGQLTDGMESDRLAAETAAQRARAAGNEPEAAKIEELYQAYTTNGLGTEGFDLNGFAQFRQTTTAYLSPNDKTPILTALLSPDFGWNDLRWQLRTMTDMAWLFAVNQPLYTVFDTYDLPYAFDVPVVLIQGENDYICSTALAEEYQRNLTAPASEMFIMPGLGHSPMNDDPVAFADVLKKALDLIV